MHSKLKKIIISALIAALACVATMVIKIPSPLNGYINLGDGIVLLCGWLLSPVYGFLAAGLGSALADVFSGYVTYAPATFLIKGAMSLIVFFTLKLMRKNGKKLIYQILGAIFAELFMILGYFLFEGILYGFAPSAVNIPANAIQGIAGIIIGVSLIKLLERTKLDLR